MQQDQRPSSPPILRPTRLIKFTHAYPSIPDSGQAERVGTNTTDMDNLDIALRPTNLMEAINHPSLPVTPTHSLGSIPFSDADALYGDDGLDSISSRHTNIMQLSGMMQAVRLPRPATNGQQAYFNPTSQGGGISGIGVIEEYWPNGIQQTGPLPVINLYGSVPFGRTVPYTYAPVAPAPASSSVALPIPVTPRVQHLPRWKVLLNTPAAKITIGLLVGIFLLYLVSRFVDVHATLLVLQQNLATPRGITLGLLSGVAFLLAFSIRGVRWKLFLNPIGKISTFKAIQLFLVGIFLNFLLPIRGGEVAKSLMLKRIANIPVSKSLPTVAMDKALDLMPALFIMVIVPFLGIQMDIRLWFVLGAVGGVLIGLIFFVALAAWKRTAAIRLLQKMTGLLPKSIAKKIEGFATGFVDSLLMAARRPRIFIPAILLTCLAVIFDGLFAMLAFWTIGFQISFGVAIFGYTVYNMFYILPTPPGQVGSNEFAGLLVFAGLLHLPADKVTAMFVFSHPWAALLMTVTGMACLSALGLNISSAMKVQSEGA